MKVYRQGDVLIKPSKKIDGKKKKDLVLAEGKMTGHSHRIISGEAALYMQATLGLLYLKVLSENAELYHEEHESIMLPMGEYEIIIQREFDWFNEETRKVVD